MTDNQQRAARVVRSMHPGHATVTDYEYHGDAGPLAHAIAAALDAAEARGRADMAAKVETFAGDLVDAYWMDTTTRLGISQRLRALVADAAPEAQP